MNHSDGQTTEHHPMKVYWGGGIAPRIIDLGTRWRWVVTFTPQPLYPQGNSHWYKLDRRLGGTQSRYGRGGGERNSQPLPGLEPLIIHPVAQRYTAELSWLRQLPFGVDVMHFVKWTHTTENNLRVDHLTQTGCSASDFRERERFVWFLKHNFFMWIIERDGKYATFKRRPLIYSGSLAFICSLPDILDNKVGVTRTLTWRSHIMPKRRSIIYQSDIQTMFYRVTRNQVSKASNQQKNQYCGSNIINCKKHSAHWS
jgi:hypothetical protein